MSETSQKSAASTETAYVQDVPYTWSFFKYQSPLLLSYVARLNGFEMPSIKQPFTYCDLGCGNGVSVNFLAAAFPQGQFYGVDFNAEHIANAQECADQGGLSNAKFIDASFDAYTKSDPPQFDYIALHGIYSWVGADIRAQVRQLIDKTLKPGGLVYVCYNCLPGWSELIPLWKMMQTYTAHLDVDSISKARIGLENMAHLRDSGAKYFRANPSASRYLDRLLERNPNYVAHEFCNACFEPQYFTDVAQEMQNIGLTYAGTAKIHRNNAANILQSKYQGHLSKARDLLDHQSRVSFLRNEFFRRDVYIRNPAPLPQNARDSLFDEMIIGSNVADNRLDSSLNLGIRKIDLKKSFYPALKTLAATGQFSFAELRDHPDLAAYDRAKITAAIHDLIAGYQFQPLSERVIARPPDAHSSFQLTSGINRFFLDHRLLKDGNVYLESQVLGSAIRQRMIYGLIVRALDGRTLAQARDILVLEISSFGPGTLAKLGKPETADTDTWLDGKLRTFERRYLPVLVKFGILDVHSNRPEPEE